MREKREREVTVKSHVREEGRGACRGVCVREKGGKRSRYSQASGRSIFQRPARLPAPGRLGIGAESLHLINTAAHHPSV